MTSILGLAYTYQNVNGTGNERYLNDHLTLGTTSNNDVKLVTNGVERMVIQANGAIDFKSPIEISAGLGSQEIEKDLDSCTIVTYIDRAIAPLCNCRTDCEEATVMYPFSYDDVMNQQKQVLKDAEDYRRYHRAAKPGRFTAAVLTFAARIACRVAIRLEHTAENLGARGQAKPHTNAAA